MTEEMIESTGGLKIFVRSWLPASAVRAVVVLVHGFKSHSGLFERTADQLAAQGFAVYALDLRGHARSEGERLFAARFGDYVDDVAGVVTLAKGRHGGKPAFVLGHSAGGVVSCLYTLDHQSEIAGLISESFAHELPAPDFALAVLKGIGHIAPHAHVLKLKDEDFSRDEAFVTRMKNDPLISKEGYEAQTVGELVRSDERLKREFSSITLPVLILHGTGDRAAKAHGSQVFYDAAGSKDKTLKLYEGHFHDLLNDVDREKVMADIVEWLTARAPRG
jgi:alpha-beta hydrolase superfamily lysophospholipase